MIFLCVFLCTTSSAATSGQGELNAAIDDALLEIKPDYEARLELVQNVYALVGESLGAGDPLVLKARFVEAMAEMRLGRFNQSRSNINALKPLINRNELPQLAFRTDALDAVLLLIAGRREESLNAFGLLFERDNLGVPESLVARSQIGYAVALNENGQAAQAVDLYEQLLFSALRRQDDEITLYAGNNLIVILITLKDFAAARETLDQLRPVIERKPDSLVHGSLQLHDLELIRVAGNPQQAIRGLERFIQQGIDTTPLMLGSAYLIYADTLRDLGRLDDALTNGNEALELLFDQAHEVTAVYLSLAEVMILQGDYAGALAQLSNVDPNVEPVPAKRVRFNRLLLEATLLQAGEQRALEVLRAFMDADENRDALASTTRAEFFQAKLTAAKRTFDLQKAEEFAQAQLRQQQADRRMNRLFLFLVTGASLLGSLLVVLQIRRRAERRRLAENTLRNQELQRQVEEKTTELRKNLDAQEQMTRELERGKRVDAIGMLVGNVAHDFNNLLQVVASSNEVIGSAAVTEGEKSSALQLSNQSLDHGAKILRQLLTYTRQQELAAKQVQFSHYLESTETLLAFALGEENQLVLRDNSKNSAIVVDPALLTTSLLNLISNAADAMPNGGTVTLSAAVIRIDDSGKCWSEDIKNGQYLLIQLTDDGMGMSESELEHAIEPFYTTKDLHAGSGLGLSSVYGFVKQSGGDLRMTSRPGDGTVVELVLPVEALKPVSGAVERPRRSFDFSGLRMLLVEDNDMVAGVLQRMLATLKLDVVRVASGREAQDRLKDNGIYDFLLTDIRMPGDLNGVQLAQWAQQQSKDIRIVLMSGFIDHDQSSIDFQMLQKPFTAVEVAAALGKLLPRPGQGEPA
ncbi:MAG: ATP-binding protein [Lysobacterales bacterium]